MIVKFSSCIIGAKDAVANDAKYSCLIEVKEKHRCGCIVVDDNWVATSRHCLRGYEENK